MVGRININIEFGVLIFSFYRFVCATVGVRMLTGAESGEKIFKMKIVLSERPIVHIVATEFIMLKSVIILISTMCAISGTERVG